MTIQPNCAESEIAHYTCYRTPTRIRVDGDLTKPAWQQAPKSGRFVDMVTGYPGWFDTRCAALWDETHLYIAFWVEEPFLEAQLSERDSTIFQENDIEVFFDGGDCYYEFEINALGTIYEVFFIWRDAYTRGSRFDTAEFDLLSRQAFSFGGDYDRRPASFWWGTHWRGPRWAFLDWDFPGLQSAVRLDGTLNDHTDIDRGWTVELAFPWEGMSGLANGRSLPPQEGDTWRMFFGRFQKVNVAGQEMQPHPAWAMNRHGIYDTHQPGCFSYVHFSTRTLAEG
jgi:hypothetical protein